MTETQGLASELDGKRVLALAGSRRGAAGIGIHGETGVSWGEKLLYL